MKIYKGMRTKDGAVVTVGIFGGVLTKALPLRLDLVNHSPTGFEWGYGGSGPAQLALAILADALADDRRADKLHQRFKFAKIGGLDSDEWTMTQEEVLTAVRKIEEAA